MSAQSIEQPYPIFTDADGDPLENGYIWIGVENLYPITNPVAVYWDAALTQPAVQPIRTQGGYPVNAGTPARLYTASSYSILVQDRNGIAVYSAQSETALTSSALVTFLQAGASAVERTAQDKMRETVSVKDFGAVGDGVADDTAALLAFYTHCIDTGQTGRINAGTYLVSTGQLVFDSAFTDKAWPVILTDGHETTIFKINPATETNAPVLAWTNGTATSAVGKYWRGGAHGGLTINGSGVGAALTSQHHISLTGTWGIQFGYMASNNCKGNSVHCPQALFGGSNPDPYANSLLSFDGIESNYSAGYGFYNGNWVGMDGWIVRGVRIIQPALGGWFGIGSGNIIENWSVANVTGWAFDDGTFTAATGGPAQRNYITSVEFDNVQNGIRLNRSSRTKFTGVRIVTRYQTTPNVTALYWPRIGVDIAGGTSPSVVDVDLDIQWRVEAGGLLANLGTYIQTTANGFFNATVDWLDNAPLGITEFNFLSNCTLLQGAPAFVTRRTKPLYDSRDKALSFARGSASTTVLNSGYGSASAILAFPTQLSGLYSASVIYNTSTNYFTAPRTGWYRFEVAIPLAVAAGTRVRIGLWNGAALIAHSENYAATANTENYQLNVTVLLSAGDTIAAMGNQSTGTASVACSPVITNQEVRFVAQEI